MGSSDFWCPLKILVQHKPPLNPEKKGRGTWIMSQKKRNCFDNEDEEDQMSVERKSRSFFWK